MILPETPIEERYEILLKAFDEISQELGFMDRSLEASERLNKLLCILLFGAIVPLLYFLFRESL